MDNRIIVAGKIIDEVTSQPLEYATISFVRAGHDTTIGTTTDKNGFFSMEIDAGIYGDFMQLYYHRILAGAPFAVGACAEP